MFQFAAGRALAIKHDVPLRLDIGDFDTYRLHQGFELERIFSFEVETAKENDFSAVLGWRKLPMVRRVLSRPRFGLFRGGRFVVEPTFDYWADFESIGKDSYITGYWQSEKYFMDVDQDIRRCFQFRSELDEINEQWKDRILKSNSVSIHIRRGDYVSNPTTNSVHGTCTLEYYHSAINEISSRVNNPVFFIFSDDLNWVMENFFIKYPVCHVSNNFGKNSYLDMWLMSLCQNNIIANSSFSWWGAWLNGNKNKIVVAPKAWFAGKEKPLDLYPEGWIVI